MRKKKNKRGRMLKKKTVMKGRMKKNVTIVSLLYKIVLCIFSVKPVPTMTSCTFFVKTVRKKLLIANMSSNHNFIGRKKYKDIALFQIIGFSKGRV